MFDDVDTYHYTLSVTRFPYLIKKWQLPAWLNRY